MHSGQDAIEPKTITVEQAAVMLGISRTTAYQLIRQEHFPVIVIRLGRRIVISLHALEALLQGEQTPGSDGS